MGSIFRDKLIPSIAGYDGIIWIAAVITLISLVATFVAAGEVNKRLELWREKKAVFYSPWLDRTVNVGYSVFTTLISLFPLLGMFGTVMALLGLDLSAGDMDNIKNNFFNALTSTAWGIIFACIFKFAHAFIVTRIENAIDGSREMATDITVKAPKKKSKAGRR